ncbi:MAG: Sjogren's syndrome/scleroderma autoantigen 1 family protein [Metallosphaera yellowstonensis]|jgi:UPF0148 protein|uniref:Putative Zn-finger containing protein n=1 Tax=Metallosphaera yellowstonensis MK1 TaxID=671065 RepID=H2C937_9CREN|nr:Sjogren's syndrome/scleroderma autoantigen 1 family protein [Metallosphaera yellowstonensis]EHP68663.1 putative Zn-finger containing protein [Metallosphaera yellowstonensis MK1]
MVDQSVRKAAELLKQGASMLSESCPVCNNPLYKLRNGEIVCPIHGKVIIAKDEEEEKRLKRDLLLDSLEETLIESMTSISKRVKEDPMDSDALLQVIRYLDSLERLRKIRSGGRGSEPAR